MPHLLIAFTLAFMPALAFACCPFDQDSLATEVDDPATLDIIAGRIERMPPQYWEDLLAQTRDTQPAGLELTLRSSDFLDRLNRQEEALEELLGIEAQSLAPAEKARVLEMQARLALHLWWRGGSDTFPSQACVDLVSESSEGLPKNPFVTHLAAWIASDQPAKPDVMLRDFFNLRYVPNKTFKVPTPQLAEHNLDGVDKQLLALIELHPVWYNFDTMHTLALCYALEGHQHLAHYTRLRAWEMHDDGEYSRLPGADQIEDIRHLTVAREKRAGVIRPVVILTDEAKQAIEQQYSAWRDYAKRWNEARERHAAEKLANGVRASSARFWAGFEAPPARIPPLQGPVSVSADGTATSDNATEEDASSERAATNSEPEKKGRGATWMTLGILLGVLFLGGAAKMRIDRSARETVESNEESE